MVLILLSVVMVFTGILRYLLIRSSPTPDAKMDKEGQILSLLNASDLGDSTSTTSASNFKRATVMPNLKPPVATTAAAITYHKSVMKALPYGSSFDPLCHPVDVLVGALDRLEAFTSFSVPDFYGLPKNSLKNTLKKSPWMVPDVFNLSFGEIVPMFAGETLQWQQLK